MDKPETIVMLIYECEHPGYLNHYIADLRRIGGTMVDQWIIYDAKIGTVEVSINNRAEFIETFKETDAYQFLN